MEHLDKEFFTELQIWIIEQKLDGKSYKKIRDLYKTEKNAINTLSCESIQTCLKRASLSLNWVKGCLCGNIPLLSEVDVFSLKQYVIENSIEGCYLNVEDTVEKACLQAAVQAGKLGMLFFVLPLHS